MEALRQDILNGTIAIEIYDQYDQEWVSYDSTGHTEQSANALDLQWFRYATTFESYNRIELMTLHLQYLDDLKEAILEDNYDPLGYDEFCTIIENTPLRSIYPTIEWAV